MRESDVEKILSMHSSFHQDHDNKFDRILSQQVQIAEKLKGLQDRITAIEKVVLGVHNAMAQQDTLLEMLAKDYDERRNQIK